MESHGDTYQGDGRSIAQIGRELGLTDQMIQSVQRDTDKPDKVAMNVWRRLCPTIDDKLFVRSIKRVPESTLDNIYGNLLKILLTNKKLNVEITFLFLLFSIVAFARLSHPKSSFNQKKMRNDIAASIRQAKLPHRTHGPLMMYRSNDGENDGDNDEDNDEDNDDVNDTNDRTDDNGNDGNADEENESNDEEEQ